MHESVQRSETLSIASSAVVSWSRGLHLLHPMGAPAGDLAVQLPTQLPDNISGKAAENVPSDSHPSNEVGDLE